MEGRLPILDYHSKANPTNGQYTEVEKQRLAKALFFSLTPPARAKKIENMDREGWQPKNIKALCQLMLESEHILSLLPQIEEKRKTSIAYQIAQQEEALKDEENMLERLPHISRHTIVNELYHYSGDIENKLQISLMPYAEDTEGLPEKEQGKLQYYAIRQKKSEKDDQGQYNPKPKVIKNSVYDVKKIPLELIDFALNGRSKPRYNGEEEAELLMNGADHDNMDSIKECLASGRPLLYDSPKNSNLIDYTERIMALKHGDKKLYMLSENTPIIYEEKSRRRYTDTNIRYTFFNSREQLLFHLGYQLVNASNKGSVFKDLKQFIPPSKEFLTQVYKDEQLFVEFAEMMLIFKEQIIGKTKLEQFLREYMSSLNYKNVTTDRMVFEAMRKKIDTGEKEYQQMLEYMQKHMDALQADPDF